LKHQTTTPTITLIAAISDNGVIGAEGDLPWRLPADLKHFKAVTTGHPILMGRKTHESIGKPLPNRRNIVLTRNAGWSRPGVETVHDLQEALRLVDDDELFVIGGEQVYRAALPIADRLLITRVHAHVRGDVMFPEFDRGAWTLTDEQHRPADEHNAHDITFQQYQRKQHDASTQ